MRLLITGHKGYIGTVMVPILRAAGHEIFGLDIGYFSFGAPADGDVWVTKDLRDITEKDLAGIDAVIHLAALSNDPLGNLDPEITYEINHRAGIRLATLAKETGVSRFLYASTCSVYGVANTTVLATEEAELHPVTPYAVSKVRTEEDLERMADDSFSPVFMRNATAYGWSPMFRADIVLNNLTGSAYLTKKIHILSDGTPWRPIVHIRDIAEAFRAVLTAPRERVHCQAFNVGVNGENYQVRDLAEIVRATLPDCEVTYAATGGPDPRSYRVDFTKLLTSVPDFSPQWNARQGVQELVEAFEMNGLTEEDFTGSRYTRLKRLQHLRDGGQLTEDFRWGALDVIGDSRK